MDNMAAVQSLSLEETIGISGGSDGGFAQDIGRVVGALVGAYFVLGVALYQNGGLFGTLD